MTLPKGWADATIGEVASVRANKADPKSLGSSPFIGLEHIEAHTSRLTGQGYATEVRSTVAQFKMGDILFGRLRPYLNKVVEASFDGCASAEIVPFTPHDGIDPSLLKRVMMSPDFLEFTASLDRGDRPRVDAKDVSRFEFLLPPAAEQRRIVAKLDALAARIARARSELDGVPVLAERIRLRAIRDVFTKPSEREILRIDELCRVGTGATPKRGEGKYYHNGSVAWVTSGAVNSHVVTCPNELITSTAIRETNCKVYPAGSLIVALYGEGKTRGKVARLGIDAATNQALAVLHAFDTARIVPDWIRLFLEARYEETRQEAAGGVQPNLNLGIIKAIQIPVPSLEDQRDGIGRIAILRAHADCLEAEAARARALLDRLESSILAKAFRGELVPQDDSDEPASVLLERIRAERAARLRKKPVPRRFSSQN